MKPDFPLCQKHGVSVGHERAYVGWAEWRRWKDIPANRKLIDSLPDAETIGTVCEWGIPARDVERWLSLATGVRPMHEWD